MHHESNMNLDRWSQLMVAWGFDSQTETFEALKAAYSESGRHYHTIEHISACMRHLDNCAVAIDSPREVEIALWFHDAIYRPFSNSNERDSADWARRFMKEAGATTDEASRVHRLIMVTEHEAPARTQNESVLVDIDLSILGAEPSVYDVFEEGIRKEYRLVPWLIYRRKRASLLRGFLNRPKIFTSGCFPEAVESQARENLSNAVSKLERRA